MTKNNCRKKREGHHRTDLTFPFVYEGNFDIPLMTYFLKKFYVLFFPYTSKR